MTFGLSHKEPFLEFPPGCLHKCVPNTLPSAFSRGLVSDHRKTQDGGSHYAQSTEEETEAYAMN